MPLSNARVQSIEPGDKPIKISDEKSMFLLINPNGSKYWRLRYRFNGKEKSLSLGTYPDVCLNEARSKRDEARKLLSQGIDPSENRKATRSMAAAETSTVAARKRFILDSNGALSFALGNRHLSLSTAETKELRTFLDATKGVANAAN